MPSDAGSLSTPSTPPATTTDSSPPALPASLHIAVHGSLESVEKRWREAWPRLAATAFQSFDWVQAWYEHLGRPQGWKICIAELRADSPDGRTVLLIPLGFRREGVLRIMGFLGDRMADYQAPLICPDFARAVTPAHAARLWNGFVDILPSVDLIRTRRMPLEIGTLANPFGALPGARHTELAHAARLPADFARFTASRETRLFADTRRQMRRLAEAGKMEILTHITEPAERRRVLDALAVQKSRRWQDSGAFDAFAVPAFRTYFDRLVDGPLQGVESVMSALMLDGQPIATHWGMRMGDRYYWIMPTYDQKWARFSPGRLLMEAVLRRCIDDGLQVFDLTAGDEAYKQQWADEHLALFSLEQPCTTLGRMAVNYGHARAFAKHIPAVRRLVRKLRGQQP